MKLAPCYPKRSPSAPRSSWLAIALAVPLLGCEVGSGAELPPIYSGERIVSAELVATHEPDLIQGLVQAAGVQIDAHYEVAFYRVVYRTLDAHGEPTNASGALMIPLDQIAPLPLLSYQHGTIVDRDDAPSKGGQEQLMALAWASLGYVTAVPDYLGLGAGDGFHPYLHAKSEAAAVIDMLRAARELMDVGGVDLAEELFLLGYSQGGHATMAALREIESLYADEFQVTAAAPIAGPYDLSGTMLRTMLDAQREQPGPHYLPYLLLAYNDVYELFATDAEMFAEPYDETVLPLFDGQHNADEINEQMPAIPLLAAADPLVDGLVSDPNDSLLRALRDNDVRGDHPDYNWNHRAPIRMYHCTGDQNVPYENAQVALATLRSNGAQVELIEPEAAKGGDHLRCAIPSVQAALVWFESLRQ